MKEIRGFSNYYITEDGYVYSKYVNRFLKFGFRKGYKYVRLCVEKGKYKNKSIHLLVLENYKGLKPNDKSIANHKDLNILNNYVDNLEWVTYRGNVEHAMINGAIKPYGKSQYWGVNLE
jgi:hypothetical protein